MSYEQTEDTILINLNSEIFNRLNNNQIEIRNQLRKWNLAIDLSFGYDPTICSCGGNLIFFELKIKDPEILKSTRLPLYNI